MLEHWDLITSGISLAFSLNNVLSLILGTVAGLIVGVLPGIGPPAGMALLLPVTFGLRPATALIFMGAIFFSSNFGGSITSIIINAPGDASNSATMLDGYPMTVNGRGNVALGISATSVIVGGGIGVILLIFSAPLIAMFALRFGPAENTLLAVFALSIIAAVVVGSPIKGLISAGLGLFLATVGYDGISGNIRFSFGIPYFEDEIQLIPAVVGMFAVSQVIILAESGGTIAKAEELSGSLLEGMKSYFRYPMTILRSLAWGIFVGALPAAGRVTSSFVAYADALRCSKNPESFGKGAPEGVIAPETANNSCAMGDMIPTLALGIPGSTAMAVFLGIMMMHGVAPGPRAFIDNGQVIYALLASQILVTLVVFVFGITCAKYFARVSLLSNEVIVPYILIFSLVGAFAIRNSFADVLLTCFFGFLGYIMDRFGYNRVPLILGLVLGEMAEKNFRRALIVSDGSYDIFYSSWIGRVLLILILFSLTYPYLKLARKRLSLRREAMGKR
ncbi:MAG: tripartite tricarboxylate transporter permease [Thermodesulfobacteriota bacterium]